VTSNLTSDTDGEALVPVAELSYAEASRELDAIVGFFEQRDVDIDLLVARLERATAIVDELDRRIHRTRAQVDELVPKLERITQGAARSEQSAHEASADGERATDDGVEEPAENEQPLF
jgi:exonuclease VII small subunit